MSLNQIVKKISEMEHGKVQVNIAQIKEVIKCFLILENGICRMKDSRKHGAYLKSYNLFSKKHEKEIRKLSKSLEK